MDLKTHYDSLYRASVEKIRNNHYKIDTQIDDLSDNRFGITLLSRPTEKIKNQIQLFLEEIKKDNCNQYFYPNSDIHITVLSIISCYPNFKSNPIEIEKYIQIINDCLKDFTAFEIEFKGITASDAAIMAQGFPTDETLNHLRDKIRNAFSKSNLKTTIDKRYNLFTAHSTVCRFKENIIDCEKMLEILSKFRPNYFGTFKVKKLELVYNDWYQKEEKTKHLHTFKLKL